MFEDWVVQKGIHQLDQGILEILCTVRVHGPKISREELMKYIQRTECMHSDDLFYCVDSGFLFEANGKYSLTDFWKDAEVYVQFEPAPVPVLKAATPYQFFEYWRNAFHVDVPTPNVRAQMLAHAKRMLRTREFEYWKRVIDLCLKDQFWKKAGGNSISSLEKAALSMNPAKKSKSDEVFGA